MQLFKAKEQKHHIGRDDFDDSATTDETPDDALVAKERKRLFVVAIMELSDEERDLVARRCGDESFRAIAADLGCDVHAAHTAVKRAIENLILKARAA
jgi:DNA-directed RNA polymerase specialized sigma24 family protein